MKHRDTMTIPRRSQLVRGRTVLDMHRGPVEIVGAPRDIPGGVAVDVRDPDGITYAAPQLNLRTAQPADGEAPTTSGYVVHELEAELIVLEGGAPELEGGEYLEWFNDREAERGGVSYLDWHAAREAEALAHRIAAPHGAAELVELAGDLGWDG